MIAYDPHNRKQPLLLGFIAMVSGILLAFFVLDMVRAGDRMDLLQGAPFLISSDIDNTIYSYRVGSNAIMPMRIGFGYITPNVNDNNNAAVTFLDEFTIDYTKTNSWEDKQSVYRKGFAYDNFGIVYGELFAPNTGGITEWTTETFHVSKTQYTSVISAPPCPYHKMTDGYYQIYFSDVDIELPESVDLGRGRYFCISIPQEHYNEFVLTTNSFTYPYLDHYVSYYDFTLNQWIGLLPVERFHELVQGYILAYADRSIKISCNNSSVFVNASQFSVNIPTNSPTPTPEITGPVPGEGVDFSTLVLRARQEFESANTSLMVINFSGSGTEGFQSFGSFQVIDRSLYDSSVVPVFRTYTDGENHYYAEVDFKYSDVYWHYITYSNDTFTFGSSYQNLSLIKTSSPYSSSFFSNFKKIAFIPSYNQGGPYFSNIFGLFYPLWNTSESVLPTPTPTPTNTPTPTLSPTPAPYVIVMTPDPSPTPTPPFIIPTMSPWNPPGDQIIPLNPDIQENVFGDFKVRIGDNNAFGLIGLLIGLLPGDLMWYLWFLLFILLVVGTAKLIIHFTGG